MEDENQKIKNKKLLLWALVVLIVLIVVVIVGVVTAQNSTTDSGAQTSGYADDGAHEEDDGWEYSGPLVAYLSVDKIYDKISVEGAAKTMLGGTQSVIVTEGEIAAATEENKPADGYPEVYFTVTTDLASFTEGIERAAIAPYIVYGLKFSVSDGRSYISKTAFADETAFATLVRRTGPSEGKPYLYIKVNDYATERNEIIESFIDWAKGVYPGEKITVTTEN